MPGARQSTTARLQESEGRLLYGAPPLCYAGILPWKPV